MIQRYGSTAILLHWSLALLMIGNLAFGLYFIDLPFSPQKLKHFAWHKWAGAIVLPLAAALLVGRVLRGAPVLPAHMPAWERHATAFTHGVLYVSYFAVPLTGWLYSSAAGFQTVLFGVLSIPDLLAKDRVLAEALKHTHRWVSYLMAGATLIHAAAAIKHHFGDRDDVLSRMLPFVRPLR